MRSSGSVERAQEQKRYTRHACPSFLGPSAANGLLHVPGAQKPSGPTRPRSSATARLIQPNCLHWWLSQRERWEHSLLWNHNSLSTQIEDSGVWRNTKWLRNPIMFFPRPVIYPSSYAVCFDIEEKGKTLGNSQSLFPSILTYSSVSQS